MPLSLAVWISPSIINHQFSEKRRFSPRIWAPKSPLFVKIDQEECRAFKVETLPPPQTPTLMGFTERVDPTLLVYDRYISVSVVGLWQFVPSIEPPPLSPVGYLFEVNYSKNTLCDYIHSSFEVLLSIHCFSTISKRDRLGYS